MTEPPPFACPFDLQLLGPSRDGALECPEAHRFERRGGVPRFVPRSTYADAFGAQWKRYTETQLDSRTGLPLSQERARRCMGESLWNGLAGLAVLECGCGAGRFTEVLLARGARVTSVDLSDAVEANAANFPPSEDHRVAQADIQQLPFEPRGFDVVFCLGVVQHTPVPELTIAALYSHVRPGGWLVLDHYRHLTILSRPVQQLARQYFKRLPPGRSLPATERLVDALLPAHRALRPLGRALVRVSPVASFYHLYPELSNELQREWALLDTHDAVTDRYKHLRSAPSIKRTMTALGVVAPHVSYGGNGVEARGRRPSGPPA